MNRITIIFFTMTAAFFLLGTSASAGNVEVSTHISAEANTGGNVVSEGGVVEGGRARARIFLETFFNGERVEHIDEERVGTGTVSAERETVFENATGTDDAVRTQTVRIKASAAGDASAAIDAYVLSDTDEEQQKGEGTARVSVGSGGASIRATATSTGERPSSLFGFIKNIFNRVFAIFSF